MYILNRDASGNLTISSPLEAHKSGMLTFSVCALDMGFDNPSFAALEMDYSELDEDTTGESAEPALLLRQLRMYRGQPGLSD